MQLVFQTDLLSKFNIHFFSRIINYFKGPLLKSAKKLEH